MFRAARAVRMMALAVALALPPLAASGCAGLCWDQRTDLTGIQWKRAEDPGWLGKVTGYVSISCGEADIEIEARFIDQSGVVIHKEKGYAWDVRAGERRIWTVYYIEDARFVRVEVVARKWP